MFILNQGKTWAVELHGEIMISDFEDSDTKRKYYCIKVATYNSYAQVDYILARYESRERVTRVFVAVMKALRINYNLVTLPADDATYPKAIEDLEYKISKGWGVDV